MRLFGKRSPLNDFEKKLKTLEAVEKPLRSNFMNVLNKAWGYDLWKFCRINFECPMITGIEKVTFILWWRKSLRCGKAFFSGKNQFSRKNVLLPQCPTFLVTLYFQSTCKSSEFWRMFDNFDMKIKTKNIRMLLTFYKLVEK